MVAESHEIKQARLEEILTSTLRDVQETKLGVQHVAAAVSRLEQSGSNILLQEAYTREQVKELDGRVTILDRSADQARGVFRFFGFTMVVVLSIVSWLFATVNQTHDIAIANQIKLSNASKDAPQEPKNETH